MERSGKNIHLMFGVRLKLTLQEVMTGYFNDAINKRILTEINHIILIGKMVISKVKYGKRKNMTWLFQEELHSRNINL